MRSFFAIPLGIFLVVSGCGDNLGKAYTVTGSVNYVGKPIANATISFVAEAGVPAKHRFKTTTTQADGSYKLEEVYAGDYSVSIFPAEAAVEIGEDPGKAPAAPLDSSSPLSTYAENSPLKAKVEEGKTEHIFNL